MSIHVVCLDGTNQTKNQSCPTNVSLLFDTLGGALQGADEGSFERQDGAAGLYGKYLPGVGAIGFPALRILGNLFGDGIAEPIVRGYTFLSRMYKAGDTVIIIGFSRGATAARALAGWVVSHGLLDPARYDVTDKDNAYRRAIAAWYRYRKGQPDLANQERLRFIGTLLGQLPTLTDTDFVPPIDVAAVGVFDTVSSLGLPHLDAQGQAVFDFSICDTHLDPKVRSGFHALAADETRDLFSPTLWVARDNVVQQLFPGAHSDVGGGYAERGLSDAALAWMAGQLNGVAKVFDLSRLTHPLGGNPLAPAHDDSTVFPFFATPRRSRMFPHAIQLSDVLMDRYGRPVAILPGSSNEKYSPKARYADGSELLPPLASP